MCSYNEIKNLPIPGEHAKTIGTYLCDLLSSLWLKEESFSGKRPFGNSGWKYDVYAALIKGGVIDGALDEDDCVNSADTEKADRIILSAIREVFVLEK